MTIYKIVLICDDCIIIDYTQYVKSIDKSVYSVGALTGIKCDITICVKDRREALDLVCKRIEL